MSAMSVQMAGDVTVPGRKLLDFFKALLEKTSITLRAGEAVVSWPEARPAVPPQ